MSDTEKSAEVRPITDRPVVVGIGASAGGLDAISRLLEGIPADSGMSFVIVQHLDPNRKSALVEILARRTPLSICEVEDDTKVEPNHIYVIPPGQYLSIKDCVLKLSEPQDPRGSRMAIDYFLTSLAEDACEFGIGVVLSGTGSDGTAGLQEIKHYGGLTVVQDPNEAEHTGMPKSAIDAGRVDYILPAGQISSRLKRYINFCQTHGPLSAQSIAHAEQSDLTPILDLMRKEVRHDFRRYRKSTLMRRIQRRMGLHQLDQLSDYLALLTDNSTERDALRYDLLIGVTRFFRNPDAWEVLDEKVVRPMFENGRQSPVRIWCAGCATGEEAYSIAMLLLEQVGFERRQLPFQIFATDVAEDALTFARAGVYPEAIMKDVPLERLRRFFKKEPGGYRVGKLLRESIVFANQNVLAQPPFAKLDLILCRNLLIYLQSEAQDRVMNVFQFALKDGGVLFQGSSESVGQLANLFAPVSKKHCIYRRNGLKTWSPSGSDYAANVQPLPEFSTQPRTVTHSRQQTGGIAASVQRQLLQQLGHGIIVVNRDNRVLYAEGNADSFVQIEIGELTAELPDVMEIARRGLKGKLRSSLRKIWNGQSTLTVEAHVNRDGTYHPCEIRIARLLGRPEDSPAVMVIFTPTTNAKLVPSKPAESSVTTNVLPVPTETGLSPTAAVLNLLELEHELTITREQLNSSISDLESANEELKAANEEAMTMNEELQSGNEELETSKEELQSLNEELTTLNNQLEIKVDELQDTTNDLENLLTSSDIPTVFLDTQFRIRRYTPTCSDLFHFIAGDIGRPLADITAYFDDDDLIDDAKAVLRDLIPREKQVASSDGKGRYRRRMLPYRTDDGRIHGVVLTLTDITDLQAAREQAQQQLAENQSIYAATPVGLAYLDTHLRYLSVNERLAEIDGFSVEEHLGKTISEVLPAKLADAVCPLYQQVIRTGEAIKEIEITGRTYGSDRDHIYLASYVPVTDESGRILGVSVVVQDITSRKQLEQELADRESHLRRVIDHQIGFVGVLDTDGTLLEVAASALEVAGLTRDDVIGKKLWECDWFSYDEVVANRLQNAFQDALAGGTVRYDEVTRVINNDRLTIEFMIQPVLDSDGKIIYLIPSAVDISDRHAAEVAMREKEQKYRMALRAGGMAAWEWTPTKSYWDPQLYDFVGLPHDSEAGPEHFFKYVHPDDVTELKNVWQQATKGVKEYYHEFRIIRADKEVRWLVGIGTVSKNEQGDVDRIYGLNWDITERMEREQNLKFLADVHAEFGPLDSSEEIIQIGNQRIAEHLGLSRCTVTEHSADGREAYVISEVLADGLPSLLGSHPTRDSLTPDEFQQLTNGQLVVIEDSQADFRERDDQEYCERLGIGSCVTAPFPAERRLKFSMTACRPTACQWPESELDVIRELTSVLFLRVDRARATEQLAASRKQLATAMESARMGSFRWDPVTDRCEWDDSWYDAIGVPRDFEQTGEAFFSLVHPDDLEIVKAASIEAIEHGKTFEVEFRICLPDGRYRWIAGNGKLATDDAGKIRLVGLNWDITNQKAATEQIRLGEQRLRSAAEAAGFGMLYADMMTGITTLSPELLHVVGLPDNAPQTITSGEAPDWVHPDDRQLCVDLYASLKVQQTDSSRSLDHRFIRPDGEVRWLHLLAKPVFSGQGKRRKITQVIGTVIDITDRRNFEDSLDEARRAAEAANDSKSAFLANMSHEIRTPMTAILGYADLMTKLVADEEAIGHLRTIRRNGDFLLGIINDILDLSKIEAGKLDVAREYFNPTHLVEDVHSIMDVRAAEGNLELTIDYEGKIPKEIESDPKRLRQILINLVGNAIKFTKEGSVRMIVSFKDDQIRFQITDTGIGLTTKQRSRLFQPFSQGDHTVNREYGGTGLGLAISQRLAAMLGGEITFDSEFGKGSSFTVTIAVGNIKNIQLLRPQMQAKTESIETDPIDITLSCHALIVDDRREIRFLTNSILSAAGATIQEAADGQLAIEAVTASQDNGPAFDIIILDMQMPRLDGYETAQALRRLNFSKPIIALTADAMQGDMKRCIECGCNDYLSKPIDKQAMLKMVSDYLGRADL